MELSNIVVSYSRAAQIVEAGIDEAWSSIETGEDAVLPIFFLGKSKRAVEQFDEDLVLLTNRKFQSFGDSNDHVVGARLKYEPLIDVLKERIGEMHKKITDYSRRYAKERYGVNL